MEKLTISEKSPVIGIDLGTTCCCVGYINSDNVIEIIENREGHKTTPSYVAFTEVDTLIGRVAKERSLRNQANVVYDTKRLIGQKYEDTFLVSSSKHNWPFKISSGEDENVCIEIIRNGMTEKYKPEYISAILLKEMKTIAEERLDTEVKNAVITVPAHFNYHQRTATKKAGELAGLNILKIINEPTAAALAYVHKNKICGEAKNILVFDLGGGTFDVSIVTVEGNSVSVKSTAGDTALGGRDFDNNLTEYIATKIQNQYKTNIKANSPVMRRIKEQSERLKINLSVDTEAYFAVLIDGKELELEITRSEFEEINSHLFEVCMNTVEICIRDAKLTKMEIDKIVLIGGSARIPKIHEMLTKSFQGKQLTKAINPDEAVAYGAAVQANIYNKDGKTEINYKVKDVTPLSLGIEVNSNLLCVIIPRNSKIPVSITNGFSTSYNNQEAILMSIYEGERPLNQRNTLIGSTEIKIPPKPVTYRVDITFYINEDGILEVSAKTIDGNYTGLTIIYEKSNISKSSNLIKDAEINKTKDIQFCKVAEIMRVLRSYNEKMKSICDYDKKGITEDEKITIRNISEEVSDWLDDNDVEDGNEQEMKAIKKKMNEIEKLCEPIVNPYGYYVKDSSINFYKQLTE